VRPGTPEPVVAEAKQSSLVTQIKYQRKKNNHFGIYEYLQVNLAYSSSRMASNRLTREQVEDLYRTNKLRVAFEPTKVDDIIEIMNHFICTKEMVDTIMEPLSPSLVRRYHYCLTYGTYADKKHQIGVGEYRKGPNKLGVPANRISSKLDELIQTYEEHSIDFDAILDFHVHFEKIHPFDDYNGRIGRIIMMKECVRLGVDPFIIGDKNRSAYHKGLSEWDNAPELLLSLVHDEQELFSSKRELCKLMQYQRPPIR
jgi:Fic family protein